MRLRTFTAPDMPTALKLMRDELGDGAIILNSEPDRVHKGVRVTAAVDDDDNEVAPQLSAKPDTGIKSSAKPEQAHIDELRFELQNMLRFHNIPELFIAKLLRKVPDNELADIITRHIKTGNRDLAALYASALEHMLAAFFNFAPLHLDHPGLRLMLVGTPGIGKTLTVAKLATHLSMQGRQHDGTLAVITTDNKRAGGIEQLQVFTDILGLTLFAAQSPDEVKDYLHSLPPRTRVLIDTAGCNPFAPAELHALKPYTSMAGIETILVMPAGGDSLEAVDMVESFASMSANRLLVTRADSARRFGGIVTAAAAHGLSFCNVSNSSKVIDALPPLNAAFLAQLLLKHTM